MPLRALDAILASLKPSALALPRPLLKVLPPRPSGFGQTRELFPRYTGQMFDAITPAVTAADLAIGFLFDEARASRLVEQNALDPTDAESAGLTQSVLGLAVRVRGLTLRVLGRVLLAATLPEPIGEPSTPSQ